MADYEDRYWTSDDGLRLHFRDYPGSDTGRAPVICIPGLTRNARDFEALADHIAGPRRVICVDLRGRGESDYARDPATYTPPRYAADLEALLAEHSIERFVSIGTSLGGLLTMLLAARQPGRIAGAVLNDIGPEVSAEGLSRIRGYVGQGRSFDTWMHAARALKEAHGSSHPGFETADWLRMAKRTMALGSGGRIAFDYDMKIAEPFSAQEDGGRSGGAGADLWPMLAALGDAPVLVVRGEASDILSPAVAARMLETLPGAELVTVPDTGHAPTLDERPARAGIDRLLARAA